ncbi:MAG TPA: hypothetical protein VJ528_04925 [Geothrix sp.]|nr:hypothetical protein [Geothrix sp.]
MNGPAMTEAAPEAQLRRAEELIRPILDSSGWGAWCEPTRWRNHPLVRAAIRKGQPLLTIQPDGSENLCHALAVAVLEQIPSDSAMKKAKEYRGRLALIKSLVA